MFGIKKHWRLYILVGLLIVSVLVWRAVFALESHAGKLLFHVLDIDQGDAIFIEAPNGNQVLIDGGPTGAVLAELGRVMPFWDRSIDLVILSHPHADHLTGLLDVLKRYRIGMVVESGVNYPTAEYTEWRRLIQGRKIPIFIAERGDILRITNDAALKLLAPFTSFVGASPKNVHDAMLVMQLSFRNSRALLMGDAESEIEYRILGEEDDLRADVLKVGHHGSKTSSTQPFLEAVRPTLAAISVGRRNRYGHPTQEVLDRLRSLGVVVKRTDEEGTLTFISQGDTFKLAPKH